MPELNELSDEALDALLRNPEKIAEMTAEPEATPPPPEPEPTPEPEPEKPIETPPQAEPEPEPEVDLEKEEMRARLAEMEARQRAQDSKIGRFAGEADYWRKQAEKGKSRPEQAPDPVPYEAEPEEPEARAPRPTTRDSIAAWAVQQAISVGEAQFRAENAEAAELMPAILERIKAAGFNPGYIFDAADPMLAQRESYRVLNEAFWDVKAERSAALRKEIEQKRTEQFTRQKEAKQRASISASGSAPPPRAIPKSLNDLTDAELDAEMRKHNAR